MSRMIDHYPVGMSECDSNGLAGNCGFLCRIYQQGECEYADEEDTKPIQLTLPFFPAAEQST